MNEHELYRGVGQSIALQEKGITGAQEQERFRQSIFGGSINEAASADRRRGSGTAKAAIKSTNVCAPHIALHSPLLARVKKPRMPSLEGFAARVRSAGTEGTA